MKFYHRSKAHIRLVIALLVSAWIEMRRERMILFKSVIALLVSAWIEILSDFAASSALAYRTPCECVD